MKKLNKKIVSYFFVSLFASVALVIGVPTIVFGAIGRLWYLLALGILAVVFGFYGTPLLWIHYANLLGYMTILRLIEEQHYYSVTDLAMQTNINEKSIVEKINYLITHFYLTDFSFDGNKLVLNERKSQSRKLLKNKCSNCGAVLEVLGNEVKCEYCGAIYETGKNVLK